MPHRCYACDPVNPHRIVTPGDGAADVRFAARFVGPPAHVNGGVAVGALACPALSAATTAGIAHPAPTRITARLRRSIVLEAPLTATTARDGDTWEVALSGEDALVTARVEIASLSAPPRAGDTLPTAPREAGGAPLAEMAHVTAEGRPTFYEELGQHQVTGCFSCGPDHPDGLYAYPRFVARDTTCATWRPAPEFTDPSGGIALPVVVAALDCSSGICLPLDDQRELLAAGAYFLLGTLDVRFLRTPPAGRGYRVVARSLGRDGRKLFGLSALFDDDGTLYATADAIWLVATLPTAAPAT